MATIPRIIASRGLETGSVVQYPTSDPVGAAVEHAGKTGLATVDRYFERQAQAERFDATLSLGNFQAQTATDMALARQNMEPGATGFHDNFLKTYDNNAKQWLSTLPKSVRPEMQMRLNTARENVVRESAEAEVKERQRYEIQGIDSRINGAQQSLLQNPDALPVWNKDVDETIDIGTLSPVVKSIKKQQAKAALQEASISGLLQRDPQDARRKLGFPGGSVVDRIIGVESGGDADATNPNSTATGSGQFINSTWLATVRKHEPELTAGKTDAQVLALRTDPSISRRMTGYLTEDNRQSLQDAGVPVTDGSLYLAHFAGAGGAISLLRNGDKSATELLGPQTVKANPFLANMTGNDVAAWAEKKMAGRPDPQYADISFARRVALGRKADVVDGQVRYDLNQQIEDDLQSVLKTGQGRDISPDSVVSNLGPVAYRQWQDKRKTAHAIFSTTNDMPQVPDSELANRLNALQPKPGEDGYTQKQQVYEAAQTRASDLIKLRRTDPAQSVMEIPEVRDAFRAIQPNDPTSRQRAVTTSLAAQSAAGIPAVVQSPITRDEAKRLAAPLLAVSRVTPESIVTKDERKVLEGVVREVQQTYGPYAEKVLPHVIEEGIKDRQFGPVATSIFKKLVRGEGLAPADRSAVEAASDVSNATQAMSATGQPEKPVPSYKAIQLLISKPELSEQFDSKYGAGAAARLLKGPAQ